MTIIAHLEARPRQFSSSCASAAASRATRWSVRCRRALLREASVAVAVRSGGRPRLLTNCLFRLMGFREDLLRWPLRHGYGLRRRILLRGCGLRRRILLPALRRILLRRPFIGFFGLIAIGPVLPHADVAAVARKLELVRLLKNNLLDRRPDQSEAQQPSQNALTRYSSTVRIQTWLSASSSMNTSF